MLEVKRKKGETFDAMLRRFQRRFQDSGRNLEIRKRRFHARASSKTKRQDSALRRLQKGSEYTYLAKIGMLKEEPKKRR
jgi:ribosomal protein S21